MALVLVKSYQFDRLTVTNSGLAAWPITFCNAFDQLHYNLVTELTGLKLSHVIRDKE